MATSRGGSLGALPATLLVAGNMIGSGLFLLPATLASIGSASVIGWAMAAGGAMALAGVFAWLGILKPVDDGIVRYPADGIHPVAGFLAWAGYWTACWIGNVAIAIAAIGYLAMLVPAITGVWPTTIAAIALIWMMATANLIGPRFVGLLSGATLLVGLAPIAVVIAAGVAGFDRDIFVGSWNVSGTPLADAVPASLVTIFWAYLGLESASVAARTVANPTRNLPIAAIGGVAIATLVYVASSVAIMGLIPAAQLARSTAPFADIAMRFLGPGIGLVVTLCALAKTLGTLGGWMLVTANVGVSGAAHGYLPRALGAERRGIPARAIVLTATLMTAAALMTISPRMARQFGMLVNASVLATLLVYLFCAVALLRLLWPLKRRVATAVTLTAIAFCGWALAAFLVG